MEYSGSKHRHRVGPYSSSREENQQGPRVKIHQEVLELLLVACMLPISHLQQTCAWLQAWLSVDLELMGSYTEGKEAGYTEFCKYRASSCAA